jgi:hypothetical protein
MAEAWELAMNAIEPVLKKSCSPFFASDMLQLFDFELRPYRSTGSI